MENTTMSTRSSTAGSRSSQKSSSKLRSEKSHHHLRRPENQEENFNFMSQNGRSKIGKRKDVFCSCRGKDDGTPMICCGQCREWYHFSCIGFTEQDTEDIDVFVCFSCQEQTGLHTVREWEGPDALEEVDEVTLAAKAVDLKSKRPVKVEEDFSDAPAPLEESEQESDPSSDEYVAENQLASRRAGKRRLRRMSTPSSNSDLASDGEDKNKAKRARLSRGSRRIHTSLSPAPVNLKRKQSNASQNQPSKKQKSGTNDDPTRKYCTGKLQEIFCQIFVKYPYFREESEGDQELDLESHFTKTAVELTDEEKSQLEDKAKEYATQVENSIFEMYSEPDKSGRPVASGKYKERFRMLDFNLRKDDRIILHKRIVSFAIPPEALSIMSSTDLASEEEKQSIKLAEQESLAHSILNKQTAPRAKITHKGLQDIEDLNGESASQRDVDMEREQEEEERRDRERMARLRAIQQQQAAGASGSVPPESPVVTENPTWGAPPPLPLHTLQRQDQAMSPLERPLSNPVFMHTASDPAAQHQVESELNLADLINIDDDISQDGMLPAKPSDTPVAENPPGQTTIDKEPEPVHNQASPSSPMSPRPTGISPFAVNTSKPDLTTRPSFDLSSVWSAPKQDEEQPKPEPPLPVPEEQKDPLMDVTFFGEEADDNDFDMFLDQDNEAGPSSEGSRKEPSFDDLPLVWNGMLHMPLDSTIPQDVPVVARQMGGRILESDSPLWKTLFPSGNLRIDGRVPVDKSSQYLLQMRLNSTKELMAVAFAPPSEPESLAFKFLMDHLLGKNRHGLVFPWGNGRPKEHHPGRELYIIPLLSSDPLPDYMELLDSLRLPKSRIENYLIGIWILNKGKLAAPPTVEPPNPISAPPPFIPPNIQIPIAPPSIPNLPLAPPPSHPQPPASAAPVNSAALAAEVASLTPDQIQRMLQSLSAAGTSIPAILQQQIQPPPPPTPPQPWSNGTPPYASFPLHHHTASQSPPHRPYSSPYPQRDQYDDGSRRGGRGARGDRGVGGRGRGGLGRGNGRDRGDRPRDSGWPKRGGRGSSNAGWGEERPW